MLYGFTGNDAARAGKPHVRAWLPPKHILTNYDQLGLVVIDHARSNDINKVAVPAQRSPSTDDIASTPNHREVKPSGKVRK